MTISAQAAFRTGTFSLAIELFCESWSWSQDVIRDVMRCVWVGAAELT